MKAVKPINAISRPRRRPALLPGAALCFCLLLGWLAYRSLF
jgi:hypothetical protein